MPPILLRPFVVPAGLFLLCTALAAQEKAKVEELWTLHCSACHGQNFEGGLGGDLSDGQWNHGAGDAEIFKSISEGNIELGMTPFKSLLTAEQIRSLVVYIREKEAAARLKQAPPPGPKPGDTFKTKHHPARLEEVAGGLDIPWSLAFLPDGRMLVTERAGQLRLLAPDGTVEKEPVRGIPKVRHRGQGGLMEVALHPDYDKNGWVYLGFSDPHPGEGPDSDKCQTAVVRGRIKDGTWTDQEWIYRAPPETYSGAGVHFGTRFVFDSGYLFFVMGERGGKMVVQDLKNPMGKIFRLHDDGRIPADNPFVGQEGVEEGIWSFGHRNPQGLAMDPRDRHLYATEHGPRGGDEFNWIRKGANYGWPVITYGMNYNGTPMTAETAREGMEQPLINWTPSIAACGLACYTGDAFPQWTHDFFAGGLASQELWRVRVQGGKLLEKELILKGVGRIRDVRSGPDGNLYLVLNNPGRIVRLTPP